MKQGNLKLTKYFRYKMKWKEEIQIEIKQLNKQQSDISDLIDDFKNRINEVGTLKYNFLLLSSL